MLTKDIKKIDLRVKRTNKLVLDTFINLLKEKAFDDIRISDICDRAMIHRTTFYNHFEDKYDLLKYALKNIINEFEIKSLDFYNNTVSRKFYINLFKSFLEHIENNKKIYLIGLSNFKSDFLSKNFKKMIVNSVRYKLEDNSKHGAKFIIPIPVLSELYYAAMVGLGVWWLQNDSNISIEETVGYLDLALNDMLQSSGTN
ncbi:MAG: TetR/AcrR family transcriptional regulator [Clostridium perfringens]|nr:TetR/AcrR family transcriptional regulator [Clostridium perfringens]